MLHNDLDMPLSRHFERFMRELGAVLEEHFATGVIQGKEVG